MEEKNNLLLLDHSEQEAYLEKNGYDLMDICDDFWGKQVPVNPLENIDIDQIYSYFERTENDPESRLEKFKEDGILTTNEKSEIVEFILEEIIENEYHPGIFAGYLDCDGINYVIISKRIGGAFDCEAAFFGIFKDENDALKALNSDGLKLLSC